MQNRAGDFNMGWPHGSPSLSPQAAPFFPMRHSAPVQQAPLHQLPENHGAGNNGRPGSMHDHFCEVLTFHEINASLTVKWDKGY